MHKSAGAPVQGYGASAVAELLIRSVCSAFNTRCALGHIFPVSHSSSTTMKRSQDHYDDGKLPPPTAAIAAKQSFPNHYHLARRIQNTSSPTPPGIVVHYLPDYPVHLPTISHHDLCLTASQPSMFPKAFLPSTIMLIVDSGASISITNDIVDFVTPPRPTQPTSRLVWQFVG